MRAVRRLFLSAGVLAAGAAQAANPAFQDFFTSVCATANTGALATRCSQTPGGTGNVSGDSESSLNPTQGLSFNQSPLAAAQSRGKEVRQRDDAQRDAGSSADAKVEMGKISLLFHAQGGSVERTVQTDLERAFDADERGAEAGFDYRISSTTVLGLLAGYRKNELTFVTENAGVNFTPQAHAGDADGDAVYLNGFAAFSLGSRGYVDISAGYEQRSNTLTRTPVFQESTRTLAQTNGLLRADVDGTTTWTSLNGGVEFGSGAFSAGLYAGGTWARSDLDGYTEDDLNDSGLAMSFSATERKSLQGHAGVRAAWVFSTAHGIVVPQVRVEYQHEFEEGSARVATSFALDPDANAYLLTGQARDTSAIEAGIGISAALANGWQPFFNVDRLTGSDDLERTRVTLGVRVEL